jgi:tRNA (guanine37-N1)-methyltransferase
MKISVLTLFPDLYEPFISTSLIKKAQEKGIVSFDISSLLAQCAPKERIDSPIAGHGAGMLIKPEIVEKSIEKQQASFGKSFTIFFSPHGKTLTQDVLKDIKKRLASFDHLLLATARYEGMDHRVEEEYADEVISLGDFVLMGGDIPAMAFIEGLLRLFPHVVGKEQSVEEDSFSGPLVDHPHYTLPRVWHGKEIPEVLLSGNHQAVDEWRKKSSIQRTLLSHFDWLRSYLLNDQEKKDIKKEMPNHYVVLMHAQVLLPGGIEGTTSVTSVDIHDIARSSRTYGIEHYFIVTPLHDQQMIVNQLIGFWQEGAGVTYNPHRHQALSHVSVKVSLEEVIKHIEEKEGKSPLLIATSAKDSEKAALISYHDQGKVWENKRPVLLIFGTGHGLAPSVMEKIDYLLIPVYGFSSFNHLSVRSAVGIILDRWLGINPKSPYTRE